MKTCLSRLIVLLLSLTLIIGLGIAAYIIAFGTPPAAPIPLGIGFRSVEAGDIVTVSVNISGEHITRAELWIEKQLIARENNANSALSGNWTVAWQWTPPAPGVYPLTARAFDQSGNYAGTTPFELVVPPHYRLVLSSNRDGKYALYSLNIATREATLISPAGSDDRQPNISAQRELAWASNRTGAWHLFTRSLSGGNAIDLTPQDASAEAPVWSPDGQRLLFEIANSGVTNLFMSDARGGNRVKVTEGEAYDGQATFAPSGNRFAFASKRGDKWDIYAVDVNGQNLARLTNDDAQDWQPNWSPDGSRIAFSSNRTGIPQIYVMSADGKGDPARVTSFPNGAEEPVWSPDGNWLALAAYTGEGDGNNRREIYLLYVPRDKPPSEGGGVVRLTQNTFDDTEPAWMPP